MDWASVAKGALAAYVAFDAFKRAARSRERRRLGDAEENDRGGKGLRSKLHNVHNIDQRVAHIVKLAQKGRTDPVIVQLARQTVSQRCGNKHCIPERAYGQEVAAIFHEVRRRVRYVRDAWGVDQFSSARRILEAGGGDCFPEATLMLRENQELVPVKELQIGDRIWGFDRWSEVVNVWAKGKLSFDRIRLDNTDSFCLTPDHKVFVVFCPTHPKSACNCPMLKRQQERVHVASLRKGMTLLVPERVPAITFARPELRRQGRVIAEIDHAFREDQAWDITTDDHYVYLPEHDVTVSQCDDYSILIGSMLGALGYPVRLRVIRTHDSPEWNHIYNMVGLPPGNPTKWVPLDASVSEPPGWQAPQSQVADIRDYEVP